MANEKELNMYSASDMDAMITSQNNDNTPVTVLGRTFKNDAERREVFRRELREKLPELKKIEGFPIGEDDDIINLSDPPYYTACPNPWLNDFIKEWEEEKKELVKQGKRVEDFDVKEPYATDNVGVKNDSVYRSVVYHTKVPQAIVIKYLLHYTQPGDIVFDGFAGTGMTGLACQTCANLDAQTCSKLNMDAVDRNKGRRHAICLDLSPYASLVAYNINSKIDIMQAKTIILQIQADLEKKYKWMYETKHSNGQKCVINSVIWSDSVICPQCGKNIVLWNNVVDKPNKKLLDEVTCDSCHTVFKSDKATREYIQIYDEYHNESRSIIHHTPVRVVYTYQKKRYEKTPDSEDIATLSKIEAENIPYYFPSDKLPNGYNTQQPIRTQKFIYTNDFYTKRSLIFLSALYDAIQKSPLSNKLKYIFCGMIIRSTNMNRVHFTKYLSGKSDWDAGNLKGTLYVPSFPVESSVLEQIKNKLTRLEKAAELLPAINDNVIMVGSAVQTNTPSNSIDYIFVDPPFGANLMYSELNYIAESWLKVKTNNTTEAIENPGQQKDSFHYQKMMEDSFSEFYRVLKPGKWITIEFSNTKAAVWNIIQNSLVTAGFVISNVSSLNKGQGGIRSITTTVAVDQDLAITCYKPSDELLDKLSLSSDILLTVWDFIQEHLEHLPIHARKDNSSTNIIERNAKILYDRLISYYVGHSYPVPMDAQEFQIGLKERFEERDGMFFTVDQVAKYDEERRKSDSFVPMALMVGDESEGIEWLKRELGNQPQAYQDISGKWMQSLAKPRKGDTIPELMTILEENFINEDGKWRVANDDDAVDMEKMRIKKLLHEFELYKKHVQTKKTKLKNTRLEVLREGFKKCYKDKDFKTILDVGDKIEQTLLEEDGVLLQYYGIACQRA